MLSALIRLLAIFLGQPENPCEEEPTPGYCEEIPTGPTVDPHGG